MARTDQELLLPQILFDPPPTSLFSLLLHFSALSLSLSVRRRRRRSQREMLDYEWGNAAAILLSSPPSVAATDEPTTTQSADDQYRQILHPYDHNLHFSSDDFIPTQSATTVSAAVAAEYTGYPCSLSLHPTGAERLGLNLNLGVRTYFPSSTPPETELVRLGRAYRRTNRNGPGVGYGMYGGGGGVVTGIKCQAEGCEADLTHTKHYYRRHKVCEFHSKAPTVVAQGLTQRFCQQCSRFHLLVEFDQGKRSCRKRLADHNRRRRKSQPQPQEPPLPPLINPLNFTAKSPAEGSSGGSRPPASPVSLTRMALGSCFRPRPGVAAARLVPGSTTTSTCTPTSSSSSRSSSNSLLPYVSDFRPCDRRVPSSSWYDHEKAVPNCSNYV